MSTWTIHHGIAAFITVTEPSGIEWAAIWMSDELGADWHRTGRLRPSWYDPPDVPKQVQDAVEDRFRRVFSLPLNEREAFCKAGREIKIEL